MMGQNPKKNTYTTTQYITFSSHALSNSLYGKVFSNFVNVYIASLEQDQFQLSLMESVKVSLGKK
jgi:hypothetical protein